MGEAVSVQAWGPTHARTVCPLDCWDVCGLVAKVERGRVVALSGDPLHPVSRGFSCHKAQSLVRLVNHEERLLHPLGRTRTGSWERLAWDQALDRLAEALEEARARFGPASVLHYTDSGSQGVLKALDKRFFARFGGSTQPRGSLCFGAGLAAQGYDFGLPCHHESSDLLNSRLVVLWGRNPVDTNVHTAAVLREARRKGTFVVLIDPVRTRSAALADWVLQPEPGTDAALAQAVARELIVSGRHAAAFLAGQTVGYAEYRERVLAWTPERAAAVTGLAAGDIRRLADLIAERRPVAFVLGWGLQRYRNGGATVRAIDALGAVAGSLGKPGGGVSYAHRHWKRLAPLDGRELPQEVRFVRRARLGEELLARQESGSPVRAAVFARANPACQAPDSGRVRQALGSVPFKAVFDFFLTDTAELADLVFPATSFLEEEDAYASSWTMYVTYGPRVTDPPGDCRPEREVYRDLAARLGMEEAAAELARPPREWLAEVFRPLGGASFLSRLIAEGAVRHPEAPAVPFAAGGFPTPSGKVELWSEAAARDGLDPLGGLEWPWPDREDGGVPPALQEQAEVFPYRLLSPQPRHRLHSIFGNQEGPPSAEREARLHPRTGRSAGVEHGDWALLTSPAGELETRVLFDEGVREGVVVIPNGGWRRSGGSVNGLVPSALADMGDQAAQYEARCRLKKAR